MKRNLLFMFGRELLCFLIIIAGCTQQVQAQNAVIEQSRFIGGSGIDLANGSKTVGGNTYIWGSTTSAGLPVTNGSAYAGSGDYYIAKYNSAGTLLFATYFGGGATEQFGNNLFEIVGDDIYFAGATYSPGLPVTNGSTFTGDGGNSDLFLVKMNTITGTIGFCTYYGSPGLTGDDYPYVLRVSGDAVYLTSLVLPSYPVTTGATFMGGSNDYGITKFNATTGNAVWSTIFGSNGVSEFIQANMHVVGNTVYIGGAVYYSATSFSASTDGTTLAPNHDGDVFYAKFDASTGNKSFLTLYGGKSSEQVVDLQVENGEAYLTGPTTPNVNGEFPTTDGSTKKGANGRSDLFALKYNAAGTVVYATVVGGTSDESMNVRGLSRVVNGYLYFMGATASSNYPTTNGAVHRGTNTAPSGNDVAVTKLNPNGAIVFSTMIGDNNPDTGYSLNVGCSDDLYVLANITTGGSMPVTSGSSTYSGSVLFKWNTATGQLLLSTYLTIGLSGGPSYTGTAMPVSLEYLSDGVVQMSGNTTFSNYASTIPGNAWAGKNDMVLTRINTCPTGYAGSTAVTPATQTVCVNGVVNQIVMAKAILSSASSPTIYLNGSPASQLDVTAQYQWQVAGSAGGPWTDIPGAIGQNYVPASSSTSKYYRRTVLTTCCGSTSVQQTGDVAAVIIGSDLAPTVNAGGTMYTCPGTAITLGGSPTATAASGSTITGYLWTPTGAYSPNNTVANPSVTPTASTIYEVLVTDNKGCQQIGQVDVTVMSADAGPATISYCGTTPVQIGTQQTAVPGVTYSWTSSPAGFTSSFAQPLVSPSVSTTYTLTLTIPLAGGGTCSTTDAITVNPVAAPTNSGGLFAGADVTVCSGGTALLGTPAESGFTYTWAPGNYLTANNTATTTFQPGSLSLPNPNPITYYVTALKSGCTFVDDVKATVIKASAGIDGCGPRTIGTADQTPGINETYTWTKVSGPGSFLGATNLPVVAVGASVGGTTVYQVDVTFNGVTCSDQVTVPDCGCLVPVITVNAPFSCPSFGLNGGAGTVSLTASSSLDYTYTWSPAAGLSSTTGATVFLTDNVSRTYTVTATSTLNPAYVCSNTITVNNPAWSLPVFASQTFNSCPGATLNIGHPLVAGYSYLWNPDSGLSAGNVSNPTATVNGNATYQVLVTDVGSGCTTNATSTIAIAGLPSNAAGTSFTLCGSATGVKLGSPAVPGVTYVWSSSPSGAVFMPNNTAAEPTVDVAITTTFTVTATNTATGCSITDQIIVTVAPPVAPFTFTNSTFCPSTSGAIALPAGPSGMTSYSWSPAAQVVNSSNNGPSATTTDPRPQVPTTYTLTVTNASGCIGQASTTLTPTGTLPNAGTDQTVCLNAGPVSIGSASNPTGAGITYLWSPATGLNDATSRNPIFTPTATGTFTFTVSKTDGGCTTTDQVTIVVNSFALPAMTSPTVCQGGCVQIGTSPSNGSTFAWSPTTGLSNANIANPIACPAATTTYTLTALGTNGCIATQKVVVTVTPTPAPTVTIPSLTACFGDDPKQFSPVVTPAGTYNYAWTPNDGTLSNINVASPMVNITSVGSKSYNLVVTNPATGCAGSATATLNVTICVPPKVSIGSTVFIDKNNDGVQSGSEETGIGGLLVKLYKADGTTLVSSTYTDSQGNYFFGDLPEGTYVVGVTPNSTYTKASTLAGTDNHVDSDNNGTQSAVGAESKSSVITLTAGQEPTGSAESGQGGTQDDSADSNGDMTIDFGFVNPSALPVDLLNFRATPGEESVDISWKTANEKDFSHYELQRSADSKEFATIATVTGNQTDFYAYRDVKPFEGRNYYRLKMVDRDGTFKLSRIISVTFEFTQKYLVVQNPAVNKSFTLITNVLNPGIQLYSVSGMTLNATVTPLGNNRFMISAPGAASGVYIVKFDWQGQRFSKKVIIP